MNRFVLFVPVLIFFALGILFFAGIGRENKEVLPSPLINKPFPDFILTQVEEGGKQLTHRYLSNLISADRMEGELPFGIIKLTA